ncbi:MAG: hypothetical protein RBG13Loki_1171 [Promethearchaeota archaeon CR_4]|nr:MAG: hypothetical protein RBG13Loki_1171 [Candidatus Lokiarchaeota archaeon CR_4]
MVSASSKGIIKQRTIEFAEKEHLIAYWPIAIVFCYKFLPFLEQEYAAIPEKERIGKGRVYIARAAVEGLFNYLKNRSVKNMEITPTSCLSFSQQVFSYALENKENFLRYLSIFLLAEVAKKDPSAFLTCESQILVWANDKDWEVREITIEFVVNGVGYYPEIIIPRIREWVSSLNANIRRFGAEGLRPRGGTKWVRDPEQNDEVLSLLGQLRFDSSEYVRKSLSNNLKDLTKYMPQKILNLLKSWVQDAGIPVTSDLASKTKREIGADNYHLIYIVKKTLRWVKAKNPELHPLVEKIIGADYLRYFDEKKNILAKPKSSM